MQHHLALLLAGILMLAGCARRETPVARGAREQVLLFGNAAEPADLDPHINNASATGTILSALFQGLVTLSNDGQTVIPGIAERWEVSQDGLTYTFHLRQNARWSNGQGILVHPSVRGWRDNAGAWIDWRELYLQP